MRKYASDTLFINKVINRFKYLNRKLGNHRYSIVAFIAGGCIELCMVKLQANGANFYKSFIEKQSLIEAERRFFKERNKEIVEKLMKNTPKEELDSVEFKEYFTKQTLKFYLQMGFWMLVGNQCVHMYYKPLANFEEEVQKQLRILEQRAEEEKEKLKAGKT